MVHSKRDILEEYGAFLQCNLILTDELLAWLRTEKVLPERVFTKIQVRARSFC